MKFLNEIDGAKRVKQDSNNRFVTDEQIANWNSKSVVNIGTFNDETELITHVITNQLPTGHYTFIIEDNAHFMLLRLDSGWYFGTFFVDTAEIFYFVVTIHGEILELKTIDLRDLDDVRAYVDSQDLLLMGYVDDLEEQKADKTYVDSKVQTDVPSGAKFTDTITTINGKTGTITKADITALGIPAQDTVYTHPASHPASMITESSTKRFVSDSEKSTWNSKSDTDTVTTINGKTGAISKADIVALGIPSQDTTYSEITTAEIDTGTASTLRVITGRRIKYILDKVSSMISTTISSLTKNDVGLGNVDNIQQATKSEFNSHNADSARHIVSSERTKWNTVISKADKTYVDSELGKKQNSLGYTPVNKSGDTMSGDLKVNGNVVAGTELIVGYNGTTESLRRHKWKYNGSSGYLELWRYSNQNKWELSATFPNRNTGAGGLSIEGKQMATEEYVNNKVKTDVPANAKFTDTVYTHPTSAGNKHIPAGGASGQILEWSSDGTAKWATPSGSGSGNSPVTSVNGKIGDVILNKNDIGLGSVLNKPQATKNDIVNLLLDYGKYECNPEDFIIHEMIYVPEMGNILVSMLAQEMGFEGIDKLMTYEGDKDKYIIIPDEIYKEGLLMTFMPLSEFLVASGEFMATGSLPTPMYTAPRGIGGRIANTENIFMFRFLENNNIDLRYLDVSNVENMQDMFDSCSALTKLDLSSWDVSNVTNMCSMFFNCSNLVELDLGSFDTSNITDMYGMFRNCSNLVELDLSSFDTSNVTDMGQMFDGCSNLAELDLSSFDTSNVTYMGLMFRNCSNLAELDLSSFDTSNVTDMWYMFRNCNSLEKIYAKTEADANRFRNSYGFPSQAEVIVV